MTTSSHLPPSPGLEGGNERGTGGGEEKWVNTSREKIAKHFAFFICYLSCFV